MRSDSHRLFLFVPKEGTHMEQLLDVRSAANLLAVSPWTIRLYVKQGKLRPIRIGRLVRLEQAELARFVASGKAGGDSVSKQIQTGEEQ
jgi:excisionase family DNA binding protein